MILKYKEVLPSIDSSCFIADNATIIGDVHIKENCSVYFHTVIRGDKDSIYIDSNSNIQDNCTLHTDPTHILKIGKGVTIGHNAILHGTMIEDESLIGMGAILMNGSHIGKHCLIGAGTLIMENQSIPDNSVVVGNPGRIIKQIKTSQIKEIQQNAAHYVALGNEYKEMQEH